MVFLVLDFFDFVFEERNLLIDENYTSPFNRSAYSLDYRRMFYSSKFFSSISSFSFLMLSYWSSLLPNCDLFKVWIWFMASFSYLFLSWLISICFMFSMSTIWSWSLLICHIDKKILKQLTYQFEVGVPGPWYSSDRRLFSFRLQQYWSGCINDRAFAWVSVFTRSFIAGVWLSSRFNRQSGYFEPITVQSCLTNRWFARFSSFGALVIRLWPEARFPRLWLLSSNIQSLMFPGFCRVNSSMDLWLDCGYERCSRTVTMNSLLGHGCC